MTISISQSADIAAEVQPLLDALQAAVNDKVANEGGSTRERVTSDTDSAEAALATDIADMQATLLADRATETSLAEKTASVNAHTTAAVEALVVSSISSIQRAAGVINSGLSYVDVVIAPVEITKSSLKVYGAGPSRESTKYGYIKSAEFLDASTIRVIGTTVNESAYYQVEVVEYA